MREEMHPVDQCEAFDALAKQGKDIADIAARFGTTEAIVRKRLAPPAFRRSFCSSSATRT